MTDDHGEAGPPGRGSDDVRGPDRLAGPDAGTGNGGSPGSAEWLGWVHELQAIAQNGLTYARDPFDVERYGQLRELAARIASRCDGTDLATVRGVFAGESGYATPKVDVRGALIREGRILLVRERSDGCWTLPGGWVDLHEPPSRAVEREVLEESGWPVRAVKLAAVLDRDLHGHPPHAFHIWKLFFLCEATGDPASPDPAVAASGAEISAVGFFPEDGLPELSLPRITAAQIGRMFAHLRDPASATDFD